MVVKPVVFEEFSLCGNNRPFQTSFVAREGAKMEIKSTIIKNRRFFCSRFTVK